MIHCENEHYIWIWISSSVYEHPVHEHPYVYPPYYKINGKKILPKLGEWQGNIRRSFFIIKTSKSSDEHSKYKMIIIITLRIWIWNFQ